MEDDNGLGNCSDSDSEAEIDSLVSPVTREELDALRAEVKASKEEFGLMVVPREEFSSDGSRLMSLAEAERCNLLMIGEDGKPSSSVTTCLAPIVDWEEWGPRLLATMEESDGKAQGLVAYQAGLFGQSPEGDAHLDLDGQAIRSRAAGPDCGGRAEGSEAVLRSGEGPQQEAGRATLCRADRTGRGESQEAPSQVAHLLRQAHAAIYGGTIR